MFLSNTTHGMMAWSAKVGTGDSGNWLSISPNAGTIFTGLLEGASPTALTVSVNTSNLAAGVYLGTITFQAPTADNNAEVVVSVALTIASSGQAAPGIGLAPASLSVEGVRGSGRVYTLTMQISNLGGGTLTWTTDTSTDNGGSWLGVSARSGTGGGLVFVSLAVGDLAAGAYTGKVTVSATGAANSPQSIPVRFNVREPIPATLAVSSLQVDFAAAAEAANPSPQTLFISNLGETTLNWTVAAATFNGGAWLSASPSSGADNGSIQVSADTTGLGAGTYQGQITIASQGAVNSPLRVPVKLTLSRPTPRFQAIGVVNAATYVSGPVAPGEILSIFGARLGPENPVTFQLDPDTGKMPESLAGVRVTFDGVPAPLYFVSFGQINMQVPFELGGKTSARLVVMAPDLDPAELVVAVAEAAPGLFTFDGRRAAALNEDNSVNSPDSPAAPGSIMQFFLTGQGLLNTKVSTGVLAPTTPPFPQPVLPVSVSIDALPARVLFAGLAPGFVGLTQINAEVPRAVLPSNNVPVSVSLGPYQAARVAMIAVR